MENNEIRRLAEEVGDYILNPDRYVYPFVIKEKNGKARTIITYNKYGNYGLRLRNAHESITKAFKINFYERNENSFAYHKDVRCYDALQSHLKSNIFIKLDIHHFFESITEELFFSIYGEYFNKYWRQAIKGLFYKGALSIGFVSSPVLSDFFMKKFDKDIQDYLLDRPELHYSRYSDDILLSSELEDDKSLNELFEFVKKELSLFNLEINEKKTRRMALNYESHNSISYLGLNISKEDEVNNKITISKRYILFLLFLIEKQRGYTDHCYPLENEIKSRIAYLAYNSPLSYQRFQKKHINKYGEPYSYVPRELEKRSASNVVNEIPNFEEYSKIFKINIHKKVTNDSFSIKDAIEIEKFLATDLEEVEIPYFVDSIGSRAFAGYNTKLKKVVLNEKLKNIDSMAFAGLSNLQEINLPKSLRFIGDQAFARTRLNKVIIPEKIKKINRGVFEGCCYLKEISLPEGLTAIMENAFRGTPLKEVVLPASLKEIQMQAFSDCEELERINLEQSNVETIGYGAFKRCVLLTYLVLPETLLSLGAEAFANCSFLRKVYIPASVLEIGSLPFENCPLLKSIEVSDDNKIYQRRNDNSSIIDKNGNLCFTIKNTIDSDVKSIGYKVFANSFIKKMVVPEGVKSISSSAFLNCKWLKSIELPESLESLGDSVFKNCISLKEIRLPQGVKRLQASVFQSCSRLEKISMSDEIEELGSGAFSGCKSLVFNLPSNLKVIGSFALENCLSLRNLYIPSKVNKIKRDAFKGLSRVLETIKVDPMNTAFGSGVNSNVIYNTKKGIVLLGCKNSIIDQGIRNIGKYAFVCCEGLKNISLPNTVQKIEKGAFAYCQNLEKIDLNTVNNIEMAAFKGCKSLKNIVLPNSLTAIGDLAFASSGLQSITIPESLTAFGKGIFVSCASLEDIHLPATFTIADLNNAPFKDCNHIKHISVNPNNQSFDVSTDCNALISKTGTLMLGSGATVIPETVKSISLNAFTGNDVLEVIIIPESVSSLPPSLFEGCSSLRKVVIKSQIEDIPLRAFADCVNLEEIVLPSSITKIDSSAFLNAKKLRNINIPESVEYIGQKAFYDTALEEVYLSLSLKTLNPYAFSGTNIKHIDIPNTVNAIAASCFMNCRKLETVKLNGQVSIGNAAFAGCVSLKTINFPEELNSIFNLAFSGCPNLVVPALPASLETIGSLAFHNNQSIKEIVLSKNIAIFSNDVFRGCPIERIVVDKDNPNFKDEGSNVITYILKDKDHNNIDRKHLLLGCKNSVIPDDVNIIDDGAFISVDKLNNFKLPSDLVEIGKNAFYKVDLGVETIICPSSLKTIKIGAFSGCPHIKQIKLNEGLKTFEGNVLDEVQELFIPASVETFAVSLFKGKRIEVDPSNKVYQSFGQGTIIKNRTIFATHKDDVLPPDGTYDLIEEDAFSNSSFDKLVIPEGVVSLKGFAKANINELYLPKSLKSISYFARNASIEKIYVDSGNPYFCTNEDNTMLFDIAKKTLYWSRSADNIPEGIAFVQWQAINHDGKQKLIIPSTCVDDAFVIDPHAFKEIVVAEDNPYYRSENNAIIDKFTNGLVFINDPANIPEGVTRIHSHAFQKSGKQYQSIFIPKTVEFIEKGAFSSLPDNMPVSIVVDKDNPVFDSRDNCNAIIVTEANLLIVKSSNTVVPDGVVVSKEVSNDGEIIYPFTNVNYLTKQERNLFFDDSNDLPF